MSNIYTHFVSCHMKQNNRLIFCWFVSLENSENFEDSFIKWTTITQPRLNSCHACVPIVFITTSFINCSVQYQRIVYIIQYKEEKLRYLTDFFHRIICHIVLHWCKYQKRRWKDGSVKAPVLKLYEWSTFVFYAFSKKITHTYSWSSHNLTH